MEVLILFALFLGHVFSGALSLKLADEKGYSGVAWFFIGLICGILGLIAAAGLPKKS